MDFVRWGVGHLSKLSVDKGLLRQTESVQHVIAALLKCDVGSPSLSLRSHWRIHECSFSWASRKMKSLLWRSEILFKTY
jgi:hypothetical protein